jgi:hypothetical protein
LTLADTTPAFAFAPVGNVPTATLTTSAPVQITGISGTVPVYIEGVLGSAYCLSTANGCACDASAGFQSAPGAITNSQFVCVRHVSSPNQSEITRSVFHAGGAAATFRVATGPILGGACNLDVDGNQVIDARTDGLILIRAMLGLTGASVTEHALGSGASRDTWAAIRQFLNGNCGSNFSL